MYPQMIKNLVDIVARTTGDPAKVNINAVARIFKVYLFSKLTDTYGDVPYFDAGKGYINGIDRPAYDRQEDIYKDFDTSPPLLQTRRNYKRVFRIHIS